MRSLTFVLFISSLLSSCAVFKSRETRSALKIRREVAHSPVFSKSFTGFTLLDPASGKTLADFNGERYFTPGSNTKILTLATCLAVLKDSVPGFIWYEYKNVIGIIPIGDPTFLHPKFQAWQTLYNELKTSNKQIFIDLWHKGESSPLGPGWSWDDADFNYSAERSFFPLYGNVKRVFANQEGEINIEPAYWTKLLRVWDFMPDSITQSETNEVITNGKVDQHFEEWLPVRSSVNYIQELLADTLHRPFMYGDSGDGERVVSVDPPYRYSTPIDTVLRRMMHQSDNFIAEQMMLVCAGLKFDRLEQEELIKWMLDSTLTNLPQRPRWVDGSGLSRYNLMTPQSIAQVLQKLWQEQPHKHLLSLFPAGGISGTIMDWYAGKAGKPYVFAKTGGMTGVQCLSGYVVCKSGKVLIFSFMHNNFIGSSRPWKTEMQRILEQIHERF